MASFIAKKIRNRAPNGSNNILVERIMNLRWIKRPLKEQENERREDADGNVIVNRVHPPKLFLKNKRRNDHRAPAEMRTRRLLAIIFVLGAGSAALWWLSDGFQSVPEGQVIAIVDNYEITTTDLATEARILGLSTESQAARRAILESLINRQILISTAVAQGLDRDPQFQAERRRAEQMLLARLAVEKEAASAQPPAGEVVQRFLINHSDFFDRRQKITLDQVRFTPATALSRNEIASIGSIDESERRLRSKAVNFERATVTVDSANLQPEAARRMMRIPTGDIFYLSEGGRGVLSKVVAREPLPVPDPERQLIARQLLSRQGVSEALRRLVLAKREGTRVRYQEGFSPAVSHERNSDRAP
jgi:EpsD family peptidyl-prolyl cis-trans isomerase